MEWIDVKDRLPLPRTEDGPDDTVRVKCKNIEGEIIYGHGNCELHRYGGTWDIGMLSGPEFYPLPEVTHWLPMFDEEEEGNKC